MGEPEKDQTDTPAGVQDAAAPTEPTSLRERLDDIKNKAIGMKAQALDMKDNLTQKKGDDGESSVSFIPESLKEQMDKIKDKVTGIKVDDVPFVPEAKEQFKKAKEHAKEGYNSSLKFVEVHTLLLDDKLDQLKGEYWQPVVERTKLMDRFIRKHPESLAVATGVTFALASRRRGLIRMMRNGVWGTVVGVGALYYVSMP